MERKFPLGDNIILTNNKLNRGRIYDEDEEFEARKFRHIRGSIQSIDPRGAIAGPRTRHVSVTCWRVGGCKEKRDRLRRTMATMMTTSPRHEAGGGLLVPYSPTSNSTLRPRHLPSSTSRAHSSPDVVLSSRSESGPDDFLDGRPRLGGGTVPPHDDAQTRHQRQLRRQQQRHHRRVVSSTDEERGGGRSDESTGDPYRPAVQRMRAPSLGGILPADAAASSLTGPKLVHLSPSVVEHTVAVVSSAQVTVGNVLVLDPVEQRNIAKRKRREHARDHRYADIRRVIDELNMAVGE